MTRTKKFLLQFLLFIPQLVWGQNDSTRSTSVVVFGNSTLETVRYNAQAIKVDFFDPAWGRAGIYYEREVGGFFSVQVGTGITFRNFLGDYLMTSGDGELEQNSSFFSAEYDLLDYDYEYNSRIAKPGYFVRLMPKFYFRSDGFKERYIGLNLLLSRYNYLAQGEMVNSANFSGPYNIKEFEKNSVAAFVIGWQRLLFRGVLDYSFSIGINQVAGKRRDSGIIADVPSNNYWNIVAPVLREVDRKHFYFEFGLKTGLWWD